VEKAGDGEENAAKGAVLLLRLRVRRGSTGRGPRRVDWREPESSECDGDEGSVGRAEVSPLEPSESAKGHARTESGRGRLDPAPATGGQSERRLGSLGPAIAPLRGRPPCGRASAAFLCALCCASSRRLRCVERFPERACSCRASRLRAPRESAQTA